MHPISSFHVLLQVTRVGKCGQRLCGVHRADFRAVNVLCCLSHSEGRQQGTHTLELCSLAFEYDSLYLNSQIAQGNVRSYSRPADYEIT